jgi:hypothetical protein
MKKSYKLLAEHDSHFEIDDGTGKPFKVAKHRLAHGTVERIRKHFADGGEVQQPTQEELDAAQVLGMPPPVAKPDGHPVVSEDARALLADPNASPAGDGAEPPTTPISLPSHQPAAAPAPTPAAPDPSAPPAGLAAGERLQEQGVQQKAGTAQAEGAASTQVLGDLAQRREQLAAESQKYLVDRQAGADALFNDIQTSKVDPDRWWSTRSTGQRIGAVVGLILGGIGAGLSRGPNYAMQAIDKAVDRDIEAQKIELGKKENLLGRYMQQTHDGTAARQMAKADAYDVAAAQLQKVSAQYSGQKAAADATITVGQLRQQAAVMRQQATERALQIAQGKIGLQQQQYQVQALQEVLKGVSGNGGFDSRVLELPAFKDYRERAVHLPDGSVAFASDKEEAHKVKDSMASVSRLRSKVQRMREMLESGSPVTTDRGQAKAVRADLLAEIGHLHDLNRLSDMDLKLFEDQVPDLTDLVKPNAAKKLDSLGKSIDDKVWSINQTMLSRPRARRPDAG